MYVEWKSFDFQVLTMVKQKKTDFFQPDIDFWEFKYYIQEKGHPLSNGLGHIIQTVNGITGVLVPTKPIYKIKRSQASIANLSTVGGQTGEELGDNNLEEKFRELGDGFFSKKTVGQLMPEAAKASNPPPASDPTPSSPPPPVQGGGCSMGAMDVSTPQMILPEGTCQLLNAGGQGQEETPPSGAKRKRGAKAKAKSKASSSPGERPSPGEPGEETPSKVGRPRRDLLNTAQNYITELKDKDATEVAFTTEYKITNRYLNRLHTDVDKEIWEETVDLARKAALTLVNKQLHAMKSLLHVLAQVYIALN